MKIFKVHYTELIPVQDSLYPALNCGYDHNPFTTEIEAESEDDIYEMFAGRENIQLDLIEPKY